MRRLVLTTLAAVGVAAALTVTASSTTEQAHVAGMLGLPVAGLVVLLEVVNVVGAWSWITDPRTHVRVESAAAVLVASTVTGICGVLTYGPIGLVAPLGLLAAVHGVSRMWTVPAQVLAQASAPLAPAVPARRDAGIPVWGPPPVAAPEPPTSAQAPAQAEVGEPEDDEVGDESAPEPPPEDNAPVQGGDRLTDEEIVVALSSLPELPGRDAVKAAYRCGTKRAERLLEDARAHRRPHLAPVKEK